MLSQKDELANVIVGFILLVTRYLNARDVYAYVIHKRTMASSIYRPVSYFLRSRSPKASCFHTAIRLHTRQKVVKEFRLADIGEGITECEVVKWIAKPEANIQSFDPLCEVQSDKATVEITSPYEGTLLQHLVQEGEVAKVGEGLCLIQTEEETDAEQETSMISQDRLNEPAVASRPHPMNPSELPVDDQTTRKDILVTPSVRHFAKQNNVDLSQIVSGSGKNGRIEKRDVLSFIEAKTKGDSGIQDASGSVELELGKTRLAMWKAMVKSLEIPHFGYSTSLDLTKLSRILPLLNTQIPEAYGLPAREQPGVSPDAFLTRPSQPSDPITHYTKLTFLPFLLKALSRAMTEWPLFRSSITSLPEPSSNQKPIVTIRPQADISVALSTSSGLYTPTLTGVDKLNVYTIMGKLRRLQTLGRQTPCGLGPEDMPKKGGTITVSNVGAIGRGEYASPVLVPGCGLAIVAIGRAKWVDVVPEDGCGPAERRLQVGISWSADHRVVEGAELAAFVETWRGWVENPERFVADGV